MSASTDPGSTSDSRAALARIELPALLLAALQLALLALVITRFRIEGDAFAELAWLSLGGFVIHALLPLRWRPLWFLALSLGGMTWVLGPPAAAWIVGLGLVLIGVCRLPIDLRLRVALLVAAGAALAWLRGGTTAVPWPAAIWPILASMFMFRLILYVYDLAHGGVGFGPVGTLNYFFMLPNVCFPLFPVVDAKGFGRCYYNAPAALLYRRGLDGMLRGIVQLLLYRWLYYRWSMTPAELDSATDLVRYLLVNYGLYLRVSGLFHLVVGMLQLFGYGLPETNRLYFLATGFNDFWRRINIYWKDFMQKIFFNPIYFRLRRRGEREALLLATLAVFLATWLLHAYQWYWLLGSFPFAWQDLLFWGCFAVLVGANTLIELRFGRERRLSPHRWSWTRELKIGLQAAATFALLCVLWSLWTSGSVHRWLSIWPLLLRPDGPRAAALALLVLAVIGITAVATRRAGSSAAPLLAGLGLARGQPALGWLLLILLVLGSSVRIQRRLQPDTTSMIRTLQSTALSRSDARLLEQGYYEHLLEVSRLNSQLWERYTKAPADWPRLRETRLWRQRDDFLAGELEANGEISFRGVPLRTNRFGMRDRDYPLRPAPPTYRIAVLGASYTMGSGVADDQTFEALLERRLDRPAGGGPAIELLNFAVGTYTLPQCLYALEHKAMDFEPRAVMYVAHPHEEFRTSAFLAGQAGPNRRCPFPEIEELLVRAGLRRTVSALRAERLLRPHTEELLRRLCRRLAEFCRARDLVPIWVLLPRVNESLGPIVVERQLGAARAAGFVTIDLRGVYDQRPLEQIALAEWDYHPNAAGHRLIAEHLYQELRRAPEPLRSALFPRPTLMSVEPGGRGR